jgi:8-amino-7-oxononanoate synthase
LERRLAEFFRTEAAILFPTGFAANAGIIPALVDKGDVILADAKNHASLIDGCRLSRATRVIYEHADAGDLERCLEDTSHARRRLIATDTLFSMDGDVAPLEDILELAERFDAMVLVDEAHALGVWGTSGRGVLEHLGLEDAPAAGRVLRVGTLSKAIGAAGGFACGPHNVVEWLLNRARTYVFSTAAPAPVVAAAMAGLQAVVDEPHRHSELLARAAALRHRLQGQGWNTGRAAGQIIPLIVGEPDVALALGESLRDEGIYVPAIRPPTVPLGKSLLRISVCFHHAPEMLDRLAVTLARHRPR